MFRGVRARAGLSSATGVSVIYDPSKAGSTRNLRNKTLIHLKRKMLELNSEVDCPHTVANKSSTVLCDPLSARSL